MAKAERSDRVKSTLPYLKKGALKRKDQQVQLLLDNGFSLSKIAQRFKKDLSLLCRTLKRWEEKRV